MTQAPTTGTSRARIRQLRLGDTARLELEAHRDALSARMEQLHDELDEVEHQYRNVVSIVGVGVGTRVPNLPPIPTLPPKPTNARAVGYNKRDPNPIESTLLALDAAGKQGITSRELAEVTQVPNGTAGARLSNLKKDGKVVHVGNRYYLPQSMPEGASPQPMAPYTRKRDTLVVHSQQEDNNTTQGGEGIAKHG